MIINLSIDRLTKLFALYYLEGNEKISFFYNTVIFKYTENSGAFLSVGSNWPVIIKYFILLIFPILACIYGLYCCVFKVKDTKLIMLIATIIGGGLGNLIDRLISNFKVIDFVNFGIGSFRTGILNVADMAVTFGIVALIFYQLKLGNSETKLMD